MLWRWLGWRQSLAKMKISKAWLIDYGFGGMVPTGCRMQNTLLDVTQSLLYEPRHIIVVPPQSLNF